MPRWDELLKDKKGVGNNHVKMRWVIKNNYVKMRRVMEIMKRESEITMSRWDELLKYTNR